MDLPRTYTHTERRQYLGDDLPLRVLLKHDVAPRQVPVQDGALVQVVEGLAHLVEEAAGLLLCGWGGGGGRGRQAW